MGLGGHYVMVAPLFPVGLVPEIGAGGFLPSINYGAQLLYGVLQGVILSSILSNIYRKLLEVVIWVLVMCQGHS